MKRIRRLKADPGKPKPSDHWRTDPKLFAALHDEFGFHVDLAADASNRLLSAWLGPGGLADDALTVRWSDYGSRGFLNPPYSSALIMTFVQKAAAEAGQGFTSVVLTPYTPDTRWWSWTKEASEIREIPHRVKYLKADGTTPAGAMFPSAVVVFRPQPGILRGEPRRVVWTYRSET